MSEPRVVIEITSQGFETALTLADGRHVVRSWQRLGPGYWSGEKGDWFTALGAQNEDDENYELAEALDWSDSNLTDIGSSLGPFKKPARGNVG